MCKSYPEIRSVGIKGQCCLEKYFYGMRDKK